MSSSALGSNLSCFLLTPCSPTMDPSLSKEPHLLLLQGGTCTWRFAPRLPLLQLPRMPPGTAFSPTATPSLPIPPPLAQLTLFILNHLSKASTATFPANLFLSIPLLQSIFSSRLSSPSCKTICYTAFSAQCMPELKAIQLFYWNTTQVPHPKLPDTHELQLLEAKSLSTGLDVSVFKVLSVKFCCSCFQRASPIYFETILVLHFPVWSLIPSRIIISCLMLISLKLLPDYVSLRPFTDT